MEMKRSPLRATLALLLFITGLAACAELDWNPLDPTFVPERIKARMPSPVELTLQLETLQEIRPVNQEAMLKAPYRLRREAGWNPGNSLTSSAAMVLIHPLDDGIPPATPDPREAIRLWPDLAWRDLNFLDYFRTENPVGPATWRRFTTGGQICVVFSQAVPALQTAQGPAQLAGYYCASAAEPLSPGQAETVVQAVKIQ